MGRKEGRIMSTWGDKETPQDVPQEWTGSTRFRKFWGVLSDGKSENREHSETCSSDIEQMQPLEKDDFLLDVNGGILDLQPTSKATGGTSEIVKIRAKFCG